MHLTRTVIDGFEFARNGSEASGRVAIADLFRLADNLSSNDGELDYVVKGGRSEGSNGHLEIKLVIAGAVHLRCQRCLQSLAFTLQIEKRLRLVAPGREWPEEEVEDESLDAIEASREMILGTLIEDEVLLALPISPRHEKCDTPITKDLKQDASPFAVLRQLKID